MKRQINNILQGFKDKNILVLGDFMLDVYLDGQCSRLAPEAGVPVLDVTQQTTCLGGAGNVVSNLLKLGSRVNYITILGQDESARMAITLLREQNINSLHVHFTELSPTLTKTRLRQDGYCMHRIDVGKKIVVKKETMTAYLADIKKAYFKSDAVFISDYNKGSITYEVLALLRFLKEQEDKIFAVDCKDYQRYKMLEPTLIKPNYNEALKIVGEEPEDDRVTQAMRWSEQLWEYSRAHLTALSLDKDGVIFNKGKDVCFHYPVRKVNTVNVAGAGDTLLSALLLAYLSGGSDYESVKIATTAAHISVQKAGTAHCTLSELRMGLIDPQDKVIKELEDLACLSDTIREQRKIVFTNGCFDIFHSGHAQYLRQAKEQGDILVVGLNNDESVRRLKGAHRPVNRLADRLEVLKQMQCIDYIIPFGNEDNDTPTDVIKALRPHVFVKGKDYENSTLPESDILQDLGIETQFISYIPHQSTTKIIERVQEKNTVLFKKIG